MQLVVFSMVLILPALLREGFLSGVELHGDCMDIIEEYGNLSCRLEGSGDLENLDPHSCTLVCSGNRRPKLPKGVCSNNDLNCALFKREELRNWGQGLQTRVNQVLEAYCPGYSMK